MSNRAPLSLFVYAACWLLLWTALGCGSEASDAGGSARRVDTKQEALSASCSGAACQLSVRLPSGVDPIVLANSSLRVNGFAQLKEPNGAFAPAANNGTGPGPHETEVGASAEVGSVLSVPPITVRSRATVSGDASSAGAITLEDPTARITGAQTGNTAISEFRNVEWSVTWPQTSAGAINLEPAQTRALQPGAYGSVAVKSRAVLQLGAGTYFFDTFAVEPDAVVQITSSAPVFVYIRDAFTWAGTFRRAVNVPNVLVVALGKREFALTRPFEATLVAPHGKIHLFSVSAPGHKGTFYADSVMIEPGLAVQKWPFARTDCAAVDPTGCGTVLGCAPKDTDADGLTDCDERADGRGWTDPLVFNGAKVSSASACHASPSCTGIDTAAEVTTCAQRPSWETRNQYSGWSWSVPSDRTNLCSGAHGFRPSWQTCGDNWQIHATAKLEVDTSGQHCFALKSETSAECGALFVAGSSSAITSNQTRCFTLSPGVYDIRWFYEASAGTTNTLRIHYCSGSAPCTPTKPLSSRLLRAEYNGSTPVCDDRPSVCTELCPCDAGGVCTGDEQCQDGLVCPAGSGPRHELDATVRVCESPLCAKEPRLVGCGYSGAPCGRYCKRPPCDGTCASGVCGTGNGWRFGEGADRVCWDPICETAQRQQHCGTTDSLCGKCACVPSCAGKACGSNTDDGCGGVCTGLCQDKQPCQRDSDCVAGSLCFPNAGARVGLPPGSNVCLPASCAATNPECGSTSSPCGTCPTCTPNPTRECGVDPLCPSSPAAECPAGQYCSAAGRCETRGASIPDVTVPDGNGGQRPVPPLDALPTSSAGAVPGSFAVTDQGTASYTIPISVPPGRAGVEPALSLQYTGSRSNGRLGVGWQLNGLSTITRCAKTFAIDGVAGPIANDETDALCLDGKRLTETYALEEVHEWHTAIESFVRVVSRGGAQLHSFTAYAKDGRRLYYGTTEDSRVRGHSGAVHTWALSRVEDASGNFMDVEYDKSGLDVRLGLSLSELSAIPTDVVPRAVRYTGHGDTPGNREVVFEYEPRPDARRGYGPGSSVIGLHSRLKSVSTRIRGKPTREYRLDYETAPNGTSRIREVTECAREGAGDVCRTPTRFEYSDIAGFEHAAQDSIAVGAWMHANNDSYEDVLATEFYVADDYKTQRLIVDAAVAAGSMALEIAQPGAGTATSLAYNYGVRGQLFPTHLKTRHALFRGTGRRSEPFAGTATTGLKCLGFGPGMIGDMDHDGLDDVLESCVDITSVQSPQSYRYEVQLYFARALGNNTFERGDPILRIPQGSHPFGYDMNGDGLQDIAYCIEGQELRVRLRDNARPNQVVFADEQIVPGSTVLCRDARKALMLDADGDGLLNLVQLAPEWGESKRPAWLALTYTAAGPRLSEAALPIVGNAAETKYSTGDFNGDGLLDLYANPSVLVDLPVFGERLLTSEASFLWVNRGDGFSLRQPNPLGLPLYKPVPFDFDADGRTDILQMDSNGKFLARKLTYDTGTLQFADVGGTYPWTDYIADADGDGSADLLVTDEIPDIATHTRDIYYGSNRTVSLLRRVQDGLGNYVDIRYDNGTPGDPTYTPGSGCAWPVKCLKRLTTLVSEHSQGYVLADHSDQLVGTTKYRYEDARVDVAGHGWLGFGKRQIRNHNASGASVGVTTVEYGQSSDRVPFPPSRLYKGWLYPFAGLATSVRHTTAAEFSSLANKTYSRTAETRTTWATRLSYHSRLFPYGQQVTTTVHDGDSPSLFTTEQESRVDEFGNVTYEKRTGPLTTEVTRVFDLDFDRRIINWQTAVPWSETITSSRGGISKTTTLDYIYDAKARPFSVTRAHAGGPLEQRVTLLRDEQGNIADIYVQDAQGTRRHTTLTYDPDGLYPIAVRNDKQQTTQLRYDERFGVPVLSSDPNGIVQQQAYDGFGRFSRGITPSQHVEASYAATTPSTSGGFRIAAALDVTVNELLSGHWTRVETDPLGRTVRVRERGYDGTTVVSETRYNATGQIIDHNRPHADGSSTIEQITVERDLLGRITRRIAPNRSWIAYDYGSPALLAGQYQNWTRSLSDALDIVRTRDSEGRAEVEISDGYGQPLRRFDAEHVDTATRATTYSYQAYNLPRAIRQNQNLSNVADTVQTLFDFDAIGRLTQVSDPNAGPRSMTYNGFDELVTVTDAESRRTEYEYDSLGRVIRVGSADGLSEFVYDGTGPNEIGRLVETVHHGSGHRERYRYEPPTAIANRGLLERVAHVRDGFEFVTRYEYDAAARVRFVHHPAAGTINPVIEHVYDPKWNNLRAVRDVTPGAAPKNLWHIDAIDQGQRIQQESLADGSTTTYKYGFGHGRVESIVTRRGGATLQDHVYTYYPDGLMQSRQERTTQASAERFTYDRLARLKSWTAPLPGGGSSVIDYTYDAFGNLQTMSGLGTYNYLPGRPQLLDNIAGNSFSYDRNGNQTTRSGPRIPGSQQTIAYTAFDLPSAITTATPNGSASTVSYEYDAAGQRAVIRSPGRTVLHAGATYERGSSASTTPGTPAIPEHRYHIFAAGRQIAELVKPNDGSASSTYSLHADALGSTTLVNRASDGSSGGSGAEPAPTARSYAPFGGPSPALPGSSGVRAGFTGHQHDIETGLINMQGRIYDPVFARFLTPDPIVIPTGQGLNRYAYVHQTPLNATDPTGYIPWFEHSDSWDSTQDKIAGYGAPIAVGGIVAMGVISGFSGSGAGAAAAGAGVSAAGAGATAAPPAIAGAALGEVATRAAGGVVLAVSFRALLDTPPPTVPSVHGATRNTGASAIGSTGDATWQTKGGGYTHGGASALAKKPPTSFKEFAEQAREIDQAGQRVLIEIFRSSVMCLLGNECGPIGIAAMFTPIRLGRVGVAVRGAGMFGARGTQMTSKTIWKGKSGMRIDVENPNPGQRPGQIHFQQGDAKYLYDPATKTFAGAPKAVNDLLETDPVQKAIQKGLRFLGE